MELYPGEISKLRDLVNRWIEFSDRELEATFSGARDTTTFLSIAQRLKAKGFEALPQEDRMNIITPQRVRFTLTGMHDIEQYCKDDTLEDKSYQAMIKDVPAPDSNLDLSEYGVRVKVRREIDVASSEAQIADMLSKWNVQKKAFRILRRWTFLGKGMRIDMSMVRSTPTNSKGEYIWQNTFRQKDITKAAATFEVEVELLRPEGVEAPTEHAETAVKQLVAGIGEVLRGIQKHPVLIRKSIANKALSGYKELTGVSVFRGNAPITMEKENMLKVPEKGVSNIRTGYNVTDKADGLRMMGYVDGQGELFMIDMSLNIYRTGLKKPDCRYSLVDGEYVTKDRDGNPLSQYLLFDIYYAPEKKDVTKESFAGESGSNAASEPTGRYAYLQDWVTRWNSGPGPAVVPGLGITQKNKIQVFAKTFLFAKEGDDSIFQACARILDTASLYYTDGLILTPNAAPLPQRPGSFEGQLKWKPSEDNTVDFLVLIDKDPDMQQVDMVSIGVKPETGENVRYKTMHLYVAADRNAAYQDPRGTVLFEQPLPDDEPSSGGKRTKSKVQPVLFNPKELPDTMANVTYRTVDEDYLTHEEFCSCENGDPILDRSIVECKYDGHAPPGWRWIPIRVRYDKTERYQRGEKGGIMNRDFSAESVWNSIHDPITLHMIRTGGERPSTDEIKEMSGEVAGVVRGDVAKVYYDRKAAKEDIQLIKGLREFHRLYIKEGLLLKTGLRGGNKTFVDLACGQGGDIQSWIRLDAKFCYGTDIAGFGIRDPQNGAYRRYLNAVMKKAGKYNDVPRMIFTIGSSGKRLATGEAGATKEESNIMRSLYGVVAPDGTIPPFVRKYGENQLRDGADCVACMFAIHYLFENEQTLAGIMQNISDSLKVGGLFVGCCFDGQRIFDALRGVDMGGSLVGKEGDAEIWRITKRYDAKDLIVEPASEGVGLGIDVEFISIGTTQREYLVPFKLLQNKMAEIGCDLMTPEECKAVGLKQSTATFDESFEMAEKDGKKFVMAKDVKRYSFFNRWFIFKRRRDGPLSGAEEDEDEATEAGRQALESAMERLEEREGLASTALAAPPAPSVKSAVVRADEEREVAIRTAVSSSTAKPSSEVPKASATVSAAVAKEAAAAAAAPAKLLLFAHDTDKTKDLLGMKKKDAKGKDVADKYAVRWLAPIAPFPITDLESKVIYPSMEHYLAAMKVKLAGKNPELAVSLFAQEGTIHQAFLNERAKKKVSEDEDQALLKEERQRVLKESESNYLLKNYKVNVVDSIWLDIRDKVLADAVKQRWETDKRFQDVVNTAKQQGYYLLHYGGPAGGSWLGGKKAVGGAIEGGNELGKAIMRAAGFRNVPL